MKRKIRYLILLMIVLVGFIYPFINVDKKVEMKAIEKVIEPYVDNEIMQLSDFKMFKKNYQIKEDEIEEFIYYSPISYMNVEEITVIKQSNEAKRMKLLEKVNTHIETQKHNFEGYGVNQTKLLKDCIVVEKGDYIICIVLEKTSGIKSDINRLFN